MWASVARFTSGCPQAVGRTVAGLATLALLATAACTSSGTDKHAASSTQTSGASANSGAIRSPSLSHGVNGASASPSRPGTAHSSSGGSGGGIHEIVPSVNRKTNAPVALRATADFGTGVTARLTSVVAVHAQANGPGEVAGPGLRIATQLTNGTDKTINLGSVVVTISDANGTPGVQMSQNGSAPFHGSLAVHRTANAVYVFTIPAGHRDPVTVNFSYSSAAPVVLFIGDAP